MDIVAELMRLEGTFKEAAHVALNMQQGVRSYNKKDTGNAAADIVTEADLAVQELLLKEMAKTELVQCRLLAEEDTPSAELFRAQNGYYLGIDPIDDTAVYAADGEHFSTIVSLHDGKDVLYVFVYFPAWDWTHRVVKGGYSSEGAEPTVAMPPEAERAIIYWAGDRDPEEVLPSDVVATVHEKGLSFRTTKSFAGNSVSLGPFITNDVAGVYHGSIDAYDGFVELAIARARGQKVYTGGPKGDIDLTDIQERNQALYYPGYYLALNETLSRE